MARTKSLIDLKPNDGPARTERNSKRSPWVSEVTRDAIRHFAWGIGDNNPLWIDPEYGPTSILETTIAPPSFAYAIDETTVAPGFDEHQRHYEKVEWQWFHPFKLGQRITVESELLGEDANSSSGVIRQYGETLFLSEGRELVAKANVTTRRDQKPLAQAQDRSEIRYNGSELSAIEDNILSEKCRGSSPRVWEDVSPGEMIGTVTKGPLSIMDIVAWCAGTMGSPITDCGYSSGGLQAETATGPQITSWMVHMITNWMGDSGFLHNLTVDFLALPFLGSTTTITGAITNTFRDDNGCWCEIEITCRLQTSDEIATGSAVVQLPTSTR